MNDVPKPGASRRRLVAARVLNVLEIVLVVVSTLADFVKREALDDTEFAAAKAQLLGIRPLAGVS